MTERTYLQWLRKVKVNSVYHQKLRGKSGRELILKETCGSHLAYFFVWVSRGFYSDDLMVLTEKQCYRWKWNGLIKWIENIGKKTCDKKLFCPLPKTFSSPAHQKILSFSLIVVLPFFPKLWSKIVVFWFDLQSDKIFSPKTYFWRSLACVVLFSNFFFFSYIIITLFPHSAFFRNAFKIFHIWT